MPRSNGEDPDQHTTFDYAFMDFMSILAASFARTEAASRGVLGPSPVRTIDELVGLYLQDESKHPSVRELVRLFHKNLKNQIEGFVEAREQ